MQGIGIGLTVATICTAIKVVIEAKGKRSKEEFRLPECYHCEASDSLNAKGKIYFCTICEKTLDKLYLEEHYPVDLYILTYYENKYKEFKEARKTKEVAKFLYKNNIEI